jgi:CheY-like chemotaxis protein
MLQYCEEFKLRRITVCGHVTYGCLASGGCLVAKILVADENSNIQKMVGLALKDQGIDVVAVGNGEAAVRKIADVKPDLVLADVFMPVRNGYEVCQFVKGDSALAHIPVILLVGAFDPLDEQEAQRVGADGVLKKPFVPPDPLISMVKSALARAGVSVGAGAAPPPVPVHKPEPVHAAPMAAPKGAPASISLPALEEFPTAEHEAVSTRPAPLRIDAAAQPLAFGNLLEPAAPAEEETEDDASYATTAQPQLEHDWKSGDEEEEVEEEEEEKPASWRRDGGNEALDEEEESSGGVKDWRETAFSDTPTRKPLTESHVPPREIPAYQEAARAEEISHAVITETPIPETTVSPAPAAPFSQDAWATALSPSAVVEPAKAAAPEIEEQVAELHEASPIVEPAISAPASAPIVEKPAAKEAWYSAVSSPWEAEAQKANQLASTWDAPEASKPEAPVVLEPEPEPEPEPVQASSYYDAGPAKEDPAATVDTLAPVLSPEVQTKVEEAALPAATVEAIREETQQITGTVIVKAPPALAGTAEPKATMPNMEDLVAKVLAQMSPDVLQAVTREILKPVVEAMVRDELNGKK